MKDRLAGFVDSGQLGIFTNGYWGHPAMKLSPEVNLLAVSHYLQALDYQRKANQVVAILGGKTPNIQNLAVGGVANAINLDNDATLNMAKLYQVKELLDEMKAVHRAGLLRRRLRDRRRCTRLARSYGAGVTNYLAGARSAARRRRARSSTCRAAPSSNGDLANVTADHVVRAIRTSRRT